MKSIGFLICAAVACWVYYDAKKRGYHTFAAICWMIGTFFLTIVFMPLYLYRRFIINPDTKTEAIGIVMLVVGVFGLVVVYSMRHPSGFGDAMMMMGQGRCFIRAPLYQLLLAVLGIICFFGVRKIVKGQKESKEKQ